MFLTSKRKYLSISYEHKIIFRGSIIDNKPTCSRRTKTITVIIVIIIILAAAGIAIGVTFGTIKSQQNSLGITTGTNNVNSCTDFFFVVVLASI